MFNYCVSQINGKQSKIAYFLYKMMLNDTNIAIYQHKWIVYIKGILTSVGRPATWMSHFVANSPSLKPNISEILKSQELQYLACEIG